MVTIINGTLFDAIRGEEKQFTEVLHGAISSSLNDLGDRIHQLEWASMAAKTPRAEAHAA
jgi:hypothetical protein